MKTPPAQSPRTPATGWTPAWGLQVPGAVPHPDDRVGFVLELGRSLHASGYDAQRLEEAMELASETLDLRGQFFSTPTSIMASFGPQDDQHTFLIRTEPGEANLGRLAQVDEVTREVIAGRKSPSQGLAKLSVIETAPAPYGTVTTLIAFGLSSGSAARFLGGGLNEVVAGCALGVLIGVLAHFAGRDEGLGRILAPVAAFVASVIAAVIAVAGFPISVFLATLAGVIVLIPGLILTTALLELSTQHLASGTARFMGALVTLLGIAFGIAIGNELASIVIGRVVSSPVRPLPDWTLAVSLIVSPLTFMILLKAQMRDAGWIILTGLVTFAGARLGSQALGAELGTFVGAFATGFVSNWYARITNRPAQIAQVPALLLLVPGSVGLRSMTSLVDQNVVVGVETAFNMILIAVSLVSGILIANVVSPRRKLVS